jgi:hypothetical protein
MVEDWKSFATTLSGDLRKLRADAPDVMKAFSSLAQSALAGGGLETKTKRADSFGYFGRGSLR